MLEPLSIFAAPLQVPRAGPARPPGRMGREPRRGVLPVRGDGRGLRGRPPGVLRRHVVQRRGRAPHGQAGGLCAQPAHQSGLFAGPLLRLHRTTLLDDRLGQGRVRRLREIPKHPQGE